MKKILLTTTALGVFAAGSAVAAGPTVTIGGHADFQVGVSDQDAAYEPAGSIYDRSTHTRTDTEVHVKVDGKTDNGLGYGAHIELEADPNGDDNTSQGSSDYSENAERVFIYVESGYGRVEAGANSSASETLKVDAGSFARATGGINGDYYHYIDLDGTAGQGGGLTDTYIVLPELPTAAFPGVSNGGNESSRNILATANKVTYYTPRVQGFQAGVSYTPDLNERGTAVGFSTETGTTTAFASGKAVPDFENVWNLGLNYQGEFNGVGLEASATGEFGDTEDTSANRDDLRAYAFGAAANFAGFTVGGSYGILDELGALASVGTEGEYWTAGAAYEYGPFAGSVTYLDSSLEDDTASTDPDKDFQNLSVGVDYQLAPGLVPYVEVSFFDLDDNTAGNTDNDGSVILFGTELNF